MSIVFCKDCKWLETLQHCYHPHNCSAPANIIRKNTYFEVVTIKEKWPYERNANNDCSLFEKV